jgi:pilus assembly protein CpaF
MVAMANLDIPIDHLRRYISSALNVIIHIARLQDGTRRLLSFQEITGMEGDVITIQELYSFQRTSIDAEGKVKGKFMFHGVRPKFIEKFKAFGISLPKDMFEPTTVLEV